ncbi:MAG TPA: lytic transglycosylase domain-containing protein [Pseudolabrys sp.]|nr:lytic transglycosylase domain-containing protein [Pseudolabrys sp.]
MPRLVAYLCLLLSATAVIAQETEQPPERGSISNKSQTQQETQQSVCLLLESAAHASDLPLEFFVRLIWRESRFRAAAVGPTTRSGRHALGIAQFMPGTAAERGVLDPFNPIEALPKAAQLLSDLRAEFGNLGLAAAAYNAGSGRVRAWMAGKASMPAQTRAYVEAVTGYSVDAWAAGRNIEVGSKAPVSCEMLMANIKQPPSPFLSALQQHIVAGAIEPWGAILGADTSRPQILDRYAILQRRFASVLAGRDPIVVERPGILLRYQVRVGAQSRAAANDVCKQIHLAGGDCVVLRNPGT